MKYPNGAAYSFPDAVEGKTRVKYYFPSRLNYRSFVLAKHAVVGVFTTESGKAESVIAELDCRMAENGSASCTEWPEWKALLDAAIAEVISDYPPDITHVQLPAIDLKAPEDAVQETYLGIGFSVCKAGSRFRLRFNIGDKQYGITNFVYKVTALAAGQEVRRLFGERLVDVTDSVAVKNAIHEIKGQVRAQCESGSLRVRILPLVLCACYSRYFIIANPPFIIRHPGCSSKGPFCTFQMNLLHSARKAIFSRLCGHGRTCPGSNFLLTLIYRQCWRYPQRKPGNYFQ